MQNVTIIHAAFIQHTIFEFLNSPIVTSADVNFNSGISAKGRWNESTTDDAIMSVLAPSVPANRHMIRDGTMATPRVTMLRSHRATCQTTQKPLETIHLRWTCFPTFLKRKSNRQQPREETAAALKSQTKTHLQLYEAFHHKLAGICSSNGGALSRRQQRNPKKNARSFAARK